MSEWSPREQKDINTMAENYMLWFCPNYFRTCNNPVIRKAAEFKSWTIRYFLPALHVESATFPILFMQANSFCNNNHKLLILYLIILQFQRRPVVPVTPCLVLMEEPAKKTKWNGVLSVNVMTDLLGTGARMVSRPEVSSG